MRIALILLQVVQVAILWLHDWLPVPPLNDVKAVRAADSVTRLVFVTFIQSVPYTIGLTYSVLEVSSGFEHWLRYWLWISYGLLFLGEIRAWWVPYLVRSDPPRAARYRMMFGRTHAFLPECNGIQPNTLHVLLHGCTAATLVVLTLLSVDGS